MTSNFYTFKNTRVIITFNLHFFFVFCLSVVNYTGEKHDSARFSSR